MPKSFEISRCENTANYLYKFVKNIFYFRLIKVVFLVIQNINRRFGFSVRYLGPVKMIIISILFITLCEEDTSQPWSITN